MTIRTSAQLTPSLRATSSPATRRMVSGSPPRPARRSLGTSPRRAAPGHGHASVLVEAEHDRAALEALATEDVAVEGVVVPVGAPVALLSWRRRTTRSTPCGGTRWSGARRCAAPSQTPTSEVVEASKESLKPWAPSIERGPSARTRVLRHPNRPHGSPPLLMSVSRDAISQCPRSHRPTTESGPTTKDGSEGRDLSPYCGQCKDRCNFQARLDHPAPKGRDDPLRGLVPAACVSPQPCGRARLICRCFRAEVTLGASRTFDPLGPPLRMDEGC